MVRKKDSDQLPLFKALLGKSPSRSGVWGVISRNSGISRSSAPTLFPEHYNLDEIEAMYFRENKDQFQEYMKDYVLVEIQVEIITAYLAVPVKFNAARKSTRRVGVNVGKY